MVKIRTLGRAESIKIEHNMLLFLTKNSAALAEKHVSQITSGQTQVNALLIIIYYAGLSLQLQ